MKNVFENFTITILKINKLVHKIKNFEVQEYGLKSIHVMCMYFLSSHPEGLTASELSKLTLEDKAAISRALKVMQEKGFISYDNNKYNAEILLTDAGRLVASAISKKMDKAVISGSCDFTNAQRQAFYLQLKTIASNLEDYYNELTEK